MRPVLADLPVLDILEDATPREGAKILPFRRVAPKPEERYTTCVPLVDLPVAAGAWRAQEGVPEPDDPNVEWVAWNSPKRFAKDMFVARVLGHSMEPVIPDGAYCLFRKVALPSSPERAVLVRHPGMENPETGGHYTVKRYREAKGPNGEKQIVLEPANAAFVPIVITSGVADIRVIAEVVEVLGASDDPGGPATDAAGAEDWLPRIGLLSRAGKLDAALDLVFDTVDDMLLEERFTEVDLWLERVPVEALDPAILVGFLTITAAAEEKLRARAHLLARVRERLSGEMASEELAKVMDGLE